MLKHPTTAAETETQRAYAGIPGTTALTGSGTLCSVGLQAGGVPAG